MTKLYFDFRDIFRAPRIAFSLQRVWINFLGLAAAFILYLIFTYVGLLVSGRGFAAMWDMFGLLPYVFGLGVPWYGWVIYWIGIVAALAVLLLTNTAVSRAVYMNLKGETFYTWKEAFQFAFKKWGSVLAAPTAILGIIAFFVIGALIMGLLGRIPYVGELGTSFLTIFYMASALFLFFLIIIFVVSLLFVPAIIATTNEDAFEAVFQTFSISTGQPWRLVVYGVLVGILELVGLVILAWAVKRSYLIFNYLFMPSMGDKFTEVTGQGMYLLQSWVGSSQLWIEYVFGDYSRYFYFARDFAPLDVGIVKEISAYIFAICMLIVGGLVLAYGEAIGNAGMTLNYLILRKKHDGENLLERKEEEEEVEEKVEAKEEKVEAEAAKAEEAKTEATRAEETSKPSETSSSKEESSEEKTK